MSNNLKTRSTVFFAILSISVLVNYAFFAQLLKFSIRNDFSSHVLLIPLVSAFLIVYRRSQIFSRIHSSLLAGGMIAGLGIVFLIYLSLGGMSLNSSNELSAKAASIVLFWIGLFLLTYGSESFRNAVFPLFFLIFMVPIPEILLDTVVAALQRGSAEMTAILFKITQTPHYRNDLTFVLPRITIEIAEQCSGIRSSLALLITSLLAAHLLLRTFWCKAALVAFAIPLAMLKNAIRITVLSLLSVHIDTRFLRNSDLHQEGGILFYLLALILMLPILSLLRRSERKRD